jgi:penicillin-binding protein 1A
LKSSDQRVQSILNWQPLDNTLVFDRDGHKIGEFFSQYHIFVPYEQLPRPLLQAILAIEDRSFWHHSGFDIRGIMRAGYEFLASGGEKKQGGSTLTQQLVRHFLLQKSKSFNRKAMEIYLAYQLEQEASKQKILEMYCNSLFMGFGSYGVGAAAKRYFGKDLAELEVHQFALLAGLFQSPSRYNPQRYPDLARKRQLQVLTAMIHAGYLSYEEARTWAKKPLEFATYEPMHGDGASSYFVDHVRLQAKELLKGGKITNNGLRIYTTLDSRLQRLAEKAVAEAGPMLDKLRPKVKTMKDSEGREYKPKIETALVSMDTKSGEVLAMVGGRDYRQSQFNRVTQALRSPGSSFKPVVYSLALMKGMRWSDVFYVSPMTINGEYRPKNPTKDYLTETTMMRSFFRSMNSPTMEIGQRLGLDEVISHAANMGLHTPIKKEFGSLLGQSETTMLDMLRMIGTFPNNGFNVEPIFITRIESRTGELLYSAPSVNDRRNRALPADINYLMVDAMRNVFQRGTAYEQAQFGSFAAGKTGTSNDSKDNWFVGYTSDLATVVWAGTDEYGPIYGNTMGSTIALPTWAAFMKEATLSRPNRPFSIPNNVEKFKVHPLYGHRSDEGIPMWFVRGMGPPTEPSALELMSRSGGSYRRHIMD